MLNNIQAQTMAHSIATQQNYMGLKHDPPVVLHSLAK